MSQRTTDSWARALTAALTATAEAAVLNDARHLLATADAPFNVNQGFATSKFSLPNGRVARPRLLVDELSAQQWDLVEAAIAPHIAAAGTIGDQFVDPAHTADISLIPTPQDISHACTCTPDAGSPCTHSVAVGLVLAERLRTTPALLFTLRGRTYQSLKKRLRTATGTAGPGRVPSPGRPPAHVHRTTTPPAASVSIPESADLDLTDLRPVLTGPLSPPPPPLPDLHVLNALTADAAHRAEALLNGNESPPSPDAGSDLARFTALEHGALYRQAAMDHLGLDVVGMGHLTLAHSHGGPAGAVAYLEPIAVDHEVLARAQADIQPLRPAPTATIHCEDNRLTDEAAGIQLRYGPDQRWYPYRAPYGTWQPVPGPSTDPAQAYRAARRAARPHRAR
ncbi:hypothetical protein AB0J01_28110 [Streptomyces sp. NPDC050204]|uniref:hypothetical protein n=1 Tax=Streptomyces sp. NPDC050204 TaxID=3155514 RepID=UPI00343F4A57